MAQRSTFTERAKLSAEVGPTKCGSQSQPLRDSGVVIGAWNGFPIERQSNLELKCEALMNPGLVPNEQVMFNIESTMSFLEVIGCYASASSDSC